MKQSYNIVQINASDTSNGGASRVALDLMSGLEKKGYGMNMFAGTHTSTDPAIEKIKKSKFDRFLSYILANDSGFFKTDYLLKTEVFKRADIIHAHNLHGWYFNLKTLRKMAKQKPVVWTLHDMWAITPHCAYAFDGKINDGFYNCPNRTIYPSLLWPNERVLKRHKRNMYAGLPLHIVVPSLWLRDKVAQSVLGDKDISLIYNGVDTDLFSPADKIEARQSHDLPLNKKIVLFIASGGLNNYFKGGKYVLEVAKYYAKNNQMVFVCVGGTEDKIVGNIIYRKGFTDKTKLGKLYSAADVLLFTSLAENFPLIVLEALSCGLPIVSFDVGGVKEAIVHEQNGYIANYTDETDLINGINFVFGLNQSEINKMRISCRERATTNFSLEKMVSGYEALYKKLV